MKLIDLWPLTLLAMLFGSIVGVFTTGHAGWFLLGLLPCIVFAKWWRI